jgi:hypothetical protein
MRKTARPVVWEGGRAQSRSPDPIIKLHFFMRFCGLKALGTDVGPPRLRFAHAGYTIHKRVEEN